MTTMSSTSWSGQVKIPASCRRLNQSLEPIRSLPLNPRSSIRLPSPGLARKERNEPLGYRPCRFPRPPLKPRPQNRAHIGIELRIADFPSKVPLEHRARHRTALAFHVLAERSRDPHGIAPLVREPHRQVEQIATLAALIERPQLRCQQLVELEGRDIGPPGLPPRIDRERAFREAQHRKMLAGVDLDLETQSHRGRVLGQEPEAERHPTLRLLPPRLA